MPAKMLVYLGTLNQPSSLMTFGPDCTLIAQEIIWEGPKLLWTRRVMV